MSKYNNDAFMKAISECKDPVVFLGLAKLLSVPLFEDEERKNARDFSDIFADIMAAYNALGRSRRKEICNALREANSAAPAPMLEESNADNTENTAK